MCRVAVNVETCCTPAGRRRPIRSISLVSQEANRIGRSIPGRIRRRDLSYPGESTAVLDSRKWSPPLLYQTFLLHHPFYGRRRSDHRDRCDECCKGRCKFHASFALNGSNNLGNAVATQGGHRLGIESDQHPRAEGRASRRSGHSHLPDLPGVASDPRRSLRDLRRQKRVCGCRSTISSGSQHSDGLEECQPTQQDDATVAPRRSLGLATIVPLCNASRGACQQANRAPTRVTTARGLLLAWQLTADRPAELLAGHRG